jgi:hypothetical protein
LQIKKKTKIGSCHTADFIPVKQEDNGTVIRPALVFPGWLNGVTNGETLLFSVLIVINEEKNITSTTEGHIKQYYSAELSKK